MKSQKHNFDSIQRYPCLIGRLKFDREVITTYEATKKVNENIYDRLADICKDLAKSKNRCSYIPAQKCGRCGQSKIKFTREFTTKLVKDYQLKEEVVIFISIRIYQANFF